MLLTSTLTSMNILLSSSIFIACLHFFGPHQRCRTVAAAWVRWDAFLLLRLSALLSSNTLSAALVVPAVGQPFAQPFPDQLPRLFALLLARVVQEGCRRGRELLLPHFQLLLVVSFRVHRRCPNFPPLPPSGCRRHQNTAGRLHLMPGAHVPGEHVSAPLHSTKNAKTLAFDFHPLTAAYGHTAQRYGFSSV
jgi:hypothetical protein